MSRRKNKSQKKKPAKVVFPKYNLVGTQRGDAIKGDRIVMYAREINPYTERKNLIQYSKNHRGQWAKGKGNVLCIIEKGIKGGRSKEVSLSK